MAAVARSAAAAAALVLLVIVALAGSHSSSRAWQQSIGGVVVRPAGSSDAAAPTAAAAAAAAAASHHHGGGGSGSGGSDHDHKKAAALRRLIAYLPKAELHLHIEGTLSVDLMFRLAERNAVELPYADRGEARRARTGYKDLQEFLDAYQVGLAVLRHEQDFAELAGDYLDTAVSNNVTHVEIFVDLQSHAARGVPVAAVVDGLQAAIDARAAHISASLILCIVRELGEAAAARTLASALPYLRRFSAIGLASAEVGHPPSDFVRVYATARLLGLHRVAHAGEEGGPDYVWSALDDLGVERVDHGIRSIEDPALVDALVQRRVPVTLCPISNLRLQVYKGHLEARLRELLSSGITVTVNSDDPAYFGAHLNDNFAWLQQVANLTADDLATLARNSFQASFIPGEAKLAAFAQIRAAVEAWRQEEAEQERGEAAAVATS